MTHLRALAKAGVTYVHLLPAFDFATVPEKAAEQTAPDCDLSAYGPASDQQQACVAEQQATDAYNWGYDPLHYTVPEGSYATDPRRDGQDRPVPADGAGAQRRRAAGGDGRRLQPHRRGRRGRPTPSSTGSCPATTSG